MIEQTLETLVDLDEYEATQILRSLSPALIRQPIISLEIYGICCYWISLIFLLNKERENRNNTESSHYCFELVIRLCFELVNQNHLAIITALSLARVLARDLLTCIVDLRINSNILALARIVNRELENEMSLDLDLVTAAAQLSIRNKLNMIATELENIKPLIASRNTLSQNYTDQIYIKQLQLLSQIALLIVHLTKYVWTGMEAILYHKDSLNLNQNELRIWILKQILYYNKIMENTEIQIDESDIDTNSKLQILLGIYAHSVIAEKSLSESRKLDLD